MEKVEKKSEEMGGKVQDKKEEKEIKIEEIISKINPKAFYQHKLKPLISFRTSTKSQRNSSSSLD
jgi:hypothetical protein